MTHKKIHGYNGNVIFQPASFFKKEAVLKVGMLDERINYWMDYDLYLRLSENYKFKYVDKYLANFLIRDGQKSNSNKNFNMIIESILVKIKNSDNKIKSLIGNMLLYTKL